VDGPLAREQALDEVAADEPGRTGHEVVHDLRSSGCGGIPAGAYPGRRTGKATVGSPARGLAARARPDANDPGRGAGVIRWSRASRDLAPAMVPEPR